MTCPHRHSESPTLSGKPNMIAMPDTIDGTGRRHRVVAIGSGFGGLTATKALKHAEVNITDALVFLTRFTAQGTSHVVNQAALWLQAIPAPAGVAATIGVLIALHVARHQRAERQRVAAQARKVASCRCRRWRHRIGRSRRLKAEVQQRRWPRKRSTSVGATSAGYSQPSKFVSSSSNHALA